MSTTTTSTNAKIVVVGCCMTDMLAYCPRLPVEGETLKGHSFNTGFGGKGANQAVMIAKLATESEQKAGFVAMVAKVGMDTFGQQTLDNFKSQGVNTEHVHVCKDPKISSGIAPIAVADNGANTIIIIGGANDLLSVEEITAAEEVIANAEILVVQLELPLKITQYAMELAQKHGTKVLLNPAPAVADLPDSFYANVDILCPNETELAILTGQPDAPKDAKEAETLASTLLGKGVKQVLVTLGEQGCLLLEQGKPALHVLPTDSDIKAVDTVGAGDSFIGAFTYFLSQGTPVELAMQKANTVAGISVTKPGTQTSYPTRAQLPKTLFEPAAI